MNVELGEFLAELTARARQADAAEIACRREFKERVAELERARSFAFRRLHLMRAVMDAVAISDGEDDAIARAAAVVRDAIGWSSDSEARLEVLDSFKAVARAAFAASRATNTNLAFDLPATLERFESWYFKVRGTPFFALFDQYVPETPTVDF